MDLLMKADSTSLLQQGLGRSNSVLRGPGLDSLAAAPAVIPSPHPVDHLVL